MRPVDQTGTIPGHHRYHSRLYRDGGHDDDDADDSAANPWPTDFILTRLLVCIARSRTGLVMAVHRGGWPPAMYRYFRIRNSDARFALFLGGLQPCRTSLPLFTPHFRIARTWLGPGCPGAICGLAIGSLPGLFWTKAVACESSALSRQPRQRSTSASAVLAAGCSLVVLAGWRWWCCCCHYCCPSASSQQLRAAHSQQLLRTGNGRCHPVASGCRRGLVVADQRPLSVSARNLRGGTS